MGLGVGETLWLGWTYQRFMTLPEKLPQFWHCTVMCSAPLSFDWKAAWRSAMQPGEDKCSKLTVRSTCEEEEHGACLLALELRNGSCGGWVRSRVAVDRGAEVELARAAGRGGKGA